MTRTVMAFGSFDILHPGHLTYLSKAKALGEMLIVVVARDSSVKMFKHRAPVFNERERMRLVGSLKQVDLAVLGNKLASSDGMFAILKRYRPDVIALGYDQKVDMAKLRKRLVDFGIRARVIRIRAKAGELDFKSSRFRGRLS